LLTTWNWPTCHWVVRSIPQELRVRVLGRARHFARAKARIAYDIGLEYVFPFLVRHVGGPVDMPVERDELVVVAPVRDGAAYLDYFVAHYRGLGARHIVLLDNGSTDGTIEQALRHPGVTLLRTRASYKRFKRVMKRYLVRRFGSRGWALCVDIDEFFDYPYRDRVPLSSLLRYLNERGYSALLAQMLDLFPAGDLQDAEAISDIKQHRFYDLADVRKISLYDGSQYRSHLVTASNAEIMRHYGGVRLAHFKADVCLTKHPLLRPNAGVRLLTSHDISRASVADFSAVLLHYKFLGDFVGYARRVVEEGSFYNNSQEYRSYLDAFDAHRALSLMTATTREYGGVEQLVNEGFLVVSPAFTRFATNVSSKGGAGARKS
jgi:glycosyltransferase involved in cell wall biosynthesis